MLKDKPTCEILKAIGKLITVGLTTILWALSGQAVCAQERQFLNSDSLVWDSYFFRFQVNIYTLKNAFIGMMQNKILCLPVDMWITRRHLLLRD